jgi:hypothetical protein
VTSASHPPAAGAAWLGAAALLLLLAASCDGPDVLGIPAPFGATADVASGDAQSATVGTALPEPLAVLVSDQAGGPLAGIGVEWRVVSGGATVTPASLTGEDGIATATVTLGTTSGSKRVTATVRGLEELPLSFDATALPGPARRLVRAAGEGQTGEPRQMLADPLAAGVLDQFGNGVPGVAVSWAVIEGGGSLLAPTSTSDQAGLATMRLTTGEPGAQRVTASAPDLAGSPVTFNATAVANVTVAAVVPIPPFYGIHDTFVRDGLAFVSAWNTGLIIYDVGNGLLGGSPANPREVSRYVTSGGRVHNAWWFWNPNGEKRYVFVGEEGPGILGSTSSGDIHVVDVSTLSDPLEVGSYRLSGAGTHNFWVDEQAQVLYAAYYNGGVVALDVSGTLPGDLSSREIARIQPGGPGATYVWGVQHAAGSVYATDMLSGFWQLRLVGGALQVAGGGNNVPERYGSDQWVAGGYAYSGTWGFRSAPGNAVKVWRLSDDGAPELVDSIITSNIGTVSDVEVSADGRLLMFSAEGGSNAGVHFYSLADAARPRRLASYLVAAGVHTATLAKIGGRSYAFAARNPGTDNAPALLVLDLTSLAP